MNSFRNLIVRLYSTLLGIPVRSVITTAKTPAGRHEIEIAVTYKNGTRRCANVAMPTATEAEAVASKAEELVWKGFAVDIAVRQALAAAV